MKIHAETTAIDIRLQLDGKEYVGELIEEPLFSGTVTEMGEQDFLGYVCKIKTETSFDVFAGFKEVDFLGFSASFYCGDRGFLIESGLHQKSIFEREN